MMMPDEETPPVLSEGTGDNCLGQRADLGVRIPSNIAPPTVGTKAAASGKTGPKKILNEEHILNSYIDEKASSSANIVKIERDSSDGPGSDQWSGAGGSNVEMRPERRMARKAELARESRKRKKVYVQTLQEKAKRYAQKVEFLEKREARVLATLGLSAVGRDEQNRRMEQLEILKMMASMLASKDSKQNEEEFGSLLKRFTQNSRVRQSKVDGLFDKVRDCLTPGLQAKFSLWLLSQDDKFYEESSFWPSLAYQELGISTDQAEKLKGFKREVIERRKSLRNILDDLEGVRGRAQGHIKSLNEAIDRMQSHLDNEQRAKFAVWVAKNKWCMEMMSVLWGKQ